MILPAILAMLAGCGGSGSAPVGSTVERSFQIVYLSNLSGEIEPCG
jgi:hypothetical protein